MRKLQLIVEGEGDQAAVPLLVRRILHDWQIFDVELPPPHIRGDINAVRKNFENYLRTALKEQCPILWVLDCDDKAVSCAVKHVQHLRAQLLQVRGDLASRVQFVFFSKEFETLFLQERSSVCKVFDLNDESIFPEKPQDKRDAKGLISKLLPSGVAYKETMHQSKIAATLDLEKCKQVSSDYRHLENVLKRLLS